MRSRPAIAVLLLVGCAVMLGACGGGGGSSDESQIKNNLSRMIAAMANRDFKTWYDLSSPGQRQSCSYGEFLNHAGGSDFSNVGIRDVKVLINGESADVTFIVTKDGKDVGAATSDKPDKWVKVGGQWYDDSIDTSTNLCDRPR